MANKIFNNEHASNIGLETPFYGKMNGSGVFPSSKFTEGMVRNEYVDYGNQYTQKISASNTTVNGTRKSGIMKK